MSEDWQPGDIVVDRDGEFFTRCSLYYWGMGWPWAYGADRLGEPANAEGVVPGGPEGVLDEHHPKRPLTLVARGGKLVR